MKNYWKKFVSLALTFAMVFSLATSGMALNRSNANTFTDPEGNIFEIVLEENDISRTSYLYDNAGNLVETLIYNKITNTLYNPSNGASLSLPKSSTKSIIECPSVIPYAGKDYEYEFCSLGESYTEPYSITVGEIIDMVTATVSVSAIYFCILTVGGFSTLIGAAKTKANACASAIYSLWSIGSSDDVIDFSFRYSCTELWESDYSYPDGGFWFLGYMPDTGYFQYQAN